MCRTGETVTRAAESSWGTRVALAAKIVTKQSMSRTVSLFRHVCKAIHIRSVVLNILSCNIRDQVIDERLFIKLPT